MRSIKSSPTKNLRRLAVGMTAFALVAAACSSDEQASESSSATANTEAAPEPTSEPSSTESSAATSDDGDALQAPGECGAGGEPATGEPIKLGALATNVPGIDFTWAPQMIDIYFDCVNDNGGIGGRPLEYSYEEASPDPALLTSLATKLVEEDGVLGIVGNMSLLECDINGVYYESNGYNPIIAGVAPGCFTSQQWSAINLGPYYSLLGAAQAAHRPGAAGKMIVVSPNFPGMDFNNTSVTDYASANGFETEGLLEDVPIADPAGLAQRLAQTAGDGGAVVLNFTGPAVLPLLQAIEDQGLIDSVVWASSTPPNDPSVAAALSDEWNDKFLINAEFNVLDSGLPDNELMLKLHSEANAEFPISAFSQMGYLIARVATEALLGIDGEINVESVNEAFFNVTGFESDMLCKPWYYQNGSSANVSNNSDRTVVPGGDVMVLKEDCFDVAALDTNPLAEIRANES